MTISSGKKRWLMSTAAALSLSAMGAGALWAWDDIPQLTLSNHPFLLSLQTKLDGYQNHYRPEKVYLHLNKTFFEPGEDIWLAAYIRDAQSLKASPQSDMVHVELLNPQGAVLQSIVLVGKDGKAAGDFNIPETTKGGLYKIRAYTRWQQNIGATFEREIQVQKPVLPNLNMRLDFERKGYSSNDEVIASLGLQSLDKQVLANHDFNYTYKLDGVETGTGAAKTDENGVAKVRFNLPKNLATNDGLLEITLSYKGQTESISRSIPIVLGNIDMSFLPEGGQWVEGIDCGMAFRALNEFGKPTDVAGIIVDDKGNKVADFNTYHQGMGAVRFAPKAGQRYKAKITQPEGINKDYPLPTANAKGYTINTEESHPDHLLLGVYSHQDEELFLVAQSRGKLYYSEVIAAKKGANSIYVDTRNFPIGITQFTLFDSKQVAQAERLAFVNPHEQLHIQVETDKEKYLPREEVKMTLRVSDQTGSPVTGDFSVAVVDDKLLSFADDKQGHLLSYVLLESDLQGEIEEPNFYFDNEKDPTRFKPEISRTKALDFLLQTQGWRTFSWERVIGGQYSTMAQPGERAVVIGRVTDAAGKPIPGAKVTALNAAKTTATADASGRYVLEGVELYEPLTVQAAAPDYQSSSLSVSYYHDAANVVLYGMRWVSGIVYDYNSQPMEGAKVNVPGTALAVQTDKTGSFKIQCAQNVNYLEVSKEKHFLNYAYVSGYADASTNVYLYSESYQQETIDDNVVMTTIATKNLEARRNTRANAGGGNVHLRNKEADRKFAPAPPAVNAVMQIDDVVNVTESGAIGNDFVDMDPEAFADGDKMKSEPNIPVVNNERDEEERREPDAEVAEEKMAAPSTGRVFAWDMDEALKQDLAQKPLARGGQAATQVKYYRARQFAHKQYTSNKLPEKREDFRQTIYWNPLVHVENGVAHLSFYNSDDISQFRVSVEGFSKDGGLGRLDYKYFTQLPFEMVVKIPTDALMGDLLSIPLALTNNTDRTLSGDLTTALPTNMRWKNSPAAQVSLNARESKTIYLQAEVLYQAEGTGNLEVQFRTAGLSDGISKPLRTRPRGFPMQQVFTGKNLSHKFQLRITDPIQGSVQARIRVYPNTLDEVMQGISSMLRMPGGCFEQTTSGNYPNVLALTYLRETNTSDPKIETMAKQYLNHGYSILAGYESPGGGFDWWGRNPAHEALTAFGIMQFIDMKAVYPEVDEKMIQRAVDWLLSRKDGKGSWNKNPQAAHTWAVSEITDAYIVYALAESGYASKISKELDKSYNDAIKSEDPYMMGLLANALLAAKDSRAKTVLGELSKMQQKDGSFKGLNHSVVASTGKALDIETTALVALAMLSNDANLDQVTKAVEWLQTGKDYYGYGSTQGTVLTLKAILNYTKASKRTAEAGTLAVYLGDKKIGSTSYTAGQKQIEEIVLSKHLAAGDQVLEVRYEGTKTALPFDLELTYATRQPNNAAQCPFTIQTQLMANSAKMGETVRLTTTLRNTTAKDQPVTMAMVGIPAGLSLQPWQLKELQEKKVFDYYEIFNGYAVFHFERMNPNQTRTIHLDLKADIPGTYEAPASSAFLYYTYEHKTWDTPQQITIAAADAAKH